MSYFYIYWPGKAIPDWLETISFSGTSNGCPVFEHGGFGYVVKKGNKYTAQVLWGPFMVIDAAGMDVNIQGGGNVVEIKSTWWEAK